MTQYTSIYSISQHLIISFHSATVCPRSDIDEENNRVVVDHGVQSDEAEEGAEEERQAERNL